jgi:hypothetical protein
MNERDAHPDGREQGEADELRRETDDARGACGSRGDTDPQRRKDGRALSGVSPPPPRHFEQRNFFCGRVFLGPTT